MNARMEALVALQLRDACINAARGVRHDKEWASRLIASARAHSRTYLAAFRAVKAARA